MINIETLFVKYNMKRIILSAAIALTSTLSLSAAMTKDFYASSSLLSSGNWVKVGVEETGVYEISYETLRQMGFADPAAVSVFGRGGRVLPESFVTNAGIPVLTDDLAPVKVLHEDNKLYFYGLGPEQISFEVNASYPTGGFFSRKSNNIYSKRGYYFLTDSRPVSPMSEKRLNSSSATSITKGVSYIYHELDSVQNTTQSGQLFWGESLNLPGATRKYWDVSLPDAIVGTGIMECVIYMPDADFGNAKIVYGMENSNYFSTPYKQTGALYYAPHEPTVSTIEIPGNKGRVLVGIDNAIDMREFANLDFWVVSYERAIPTMRGINGEKLNQQLLALPSLGKNSTGKLELENSASLIVLDVTSETDPQKLLISQSGNKGTVEVQCGSKPPVLVIFDKDKQQLQISGYENDYYKIENQNLHSYKNEGADFIIITTPRFKQYADELADLHREKDGLKVIVATTEECFNEFSGGTPDPMAYRSFAKMLYFSDRKPKNMLLFGPLFSDYRGLNSEHNPVESLIAYQSPSISIARGAHNINDFYGMMSDKFRTDYYERNDVQIGIGILPVKFDSEARTIVNKIKDYTERDDHAYYLNKYIGIGGVGDEHTHDKQIKELNSYIRTMDNAGTIFTPIAIDTYGNNEARKKFLNQLNEGCSMFSYFGHGAEQFLGKDRYFFNAGDVYNLKNRMLPFALFGGCQITNTDRGFRGLGETIVTGTPHGCIGSIVSARDTWSGQNYEFFKQFFNCLFTEGPDNTSPHRSKAVTIGEVYANVKNYSTYSNELAYQLLCDPALVIPVINRSIDVKTSSSSNVELKPGEKFKLSGTVIYPDGTLDNEFNGQIVIRLNEPEKNIPAGCLETGEDPKDLEYTYRDNQVSITSGEIKNGKFEIDLYIPGTMSSFVGEKALIYFSAYDPSKRVGGAKCYTAAVGSMSSSSPELSDKIPPVIEILDFDNTDCSINFTVSDNVALNMASSPFNKGSYIYLDGKEYSEANFIEPIIESGRAAYSKNIKLDALSYGEHTVRLKVKDVAGNSSEKEVVFVYSPIKAMYAISRDDAGASQSTTIRVLGAMPQSAEVVIISPTGTEIWRGKLNGNSLIWNHEYSQGGKVPAGHYKAYLIETGSGTSKGHSEYIDIPVI